MREPDLSRAAWRKSSYSNGTGGSCVEVAALPHGSTGASRPGSRTQTATPAGMTGHSDHHIAVRDSKDPRGPALAFAAAEWSAFTAEVKAGHHDIP